MRALGQEYKQAEASTGEFERLPAGGYVCRIVRVEDCDKEEKPYLHVVYDIAEGEYARFYDTDWGKDTSHDWAHDMRQYYTPAAFGVFKGFLKAVDISNGTNLEATAEQGMDERKLCGLLIGLIIGEEEYESNTGDVRTRLRVRGTRPAQTIRDGKFKQPELKKLPLAEIDSMIEATPETLNDDDLPF